MTEEHATNVSGLPEVTITERGLSADEVSTLLLLLADTRELAEQSRIECSAAVERADQADSKAQSLQLEIEGMTTTLASLEGELLSATSSLRLARERVEVLERELELAEQRASSAEASVACLDAALAETAKSEAILRAELADIRQSTSWRASAPLRSVSNLLHRDQSAE
jgi:chromosome segregation ATPase